MLNTVPLDIWWSLRGHSGACPLHTAAVPTPPCCLCSASLLGHSFLQLTCPCAQRRRGFSCPGAFEERAESRETRQGDPKPRGTWRCSDSRSMGCSLRTHQNCNHGGRQLSLGSEALNLKTPHAQGSSGDSQGQQGASQHNQSGPKTGRSPECSYKTPNALHDTGVWGGPNGRQFLTGR